MEGEKGEHFVLCLFVNEYFTLLNEHLLLYVNEHYSAKF